MPLEPGAYIEAPNSSDTETSSLLEASLPLCTLDTPRLQLA